MKIRLLTFLFFAIGGIGFEYDPGTGNDVSRYQLTRILVSDGQLPYRVEFQYVHTFNTSFSLMIRMTNSLYSNALIYSQSFASPRTVTRAFEVPSSMVHRASQWTFTSQSSLGTKHWTLRSQPRQKEWITASSLTSWESAYATQEINEVGLVVNQREKLFFQGFEPTRVESFYGRLSLSHLKVEWVNRPLSWQQSIHAYLLVANDVLFSDLYIWNDQWNYIPLDIVEDGDYLLLQFPTLYVDPHRLRISQVPLQDYVSTSHFYFPIDQFHRFQQTPFQVHLELQHLTDLTVSYSFLYQALYPLLGPCSISQFCVRIPYA